MKFNLTCPRCGGKGKLRNACPTCGGEGRVAQTETVEVRIPPGAQQRLPPARAGQGQCRHHGRSSRRSLHHHTKVEEHPFFQPRRRQHRNQVPVTVTEAALGAKIEVPTIDGRTLLKIPQGTQNGQQVPAARKGRFQFAHRTSAATRSWRWCIQAPESRDERTTRDSARTRQAASGRSARAKSGTKV